MSASTSTTIWDKILPPQSVNNELYLAPPQDYYRLLFETVATASGIKVPTEQYSLEVSDRVPLEDMASSPIGLRFLQMVVKLTGARRVFEIGTYIGLSAMAMAGVMPPGGKVVTVEKFDHFAGIARRNIERNGLSDRIDVIQGDAFEIVERMSKDQLFDIVFIDGNKERYTHYFQVLEPLVRPGGLAIVDDCLFHGDVLNPSPNTEKGVGARTMLDHAAKLQDWLRLVVPISNGILMMVKPGG